MFPAHLEPTSTLAILVLMIFVAGTGTFYRGVSNFRRMTDLDTSAWSADAPTQRYEHEPDKLDDLRPPRERVLDYVHESGGKIYQQELVQMMDRSASTVSRYLSKLEDDGQIVRIRDQKQNIVMIAGDEYDWTWELPESNS